MLDTSPFAKRELLAGTYIKVNGQELSSGLLREREGEVNFAAVGGRAEMAIANSWVADGVVVWFWNEAFEFLDQAESGIVDIGAGAGVDSWEESQYGSKGLSPGKHIECACFESLVLRRSLRI
jgi:hypothetical protein